MRYIITSIVLITTLVSCTSHNISTTQTLTGNISTGVEMSKPSSSTETTSPLKNVSHLFDIQDERSSETIQSAISTELTNVVHNNLQLNSSNSINVSVISENEMALMGLPERTQIVVTTGTYDSEKHSGTWIAFRYLFENTWQLLLSDNKKFTCIDIPEVYKIFLQDQFNDCPATMWKK